MSDKTKAQYKADAGKLEPKENHGGYQVWAGHEYASVRDTHSGKTLKTFYGVSAEAEADAYALAKSNADADAQWKSMEEFMRA